jgi:hypothetical protein
MLNKYSMKKTVIILSVLSLLFCTYGQAQEIFTDTISKKEYLFLGEMSYCAQKKELIKVLDEKGEISLEPLSELVQSDLLKSKDFLTRIFNQKLTFVLNGSNHWLAEFNIDSLKFHYEDDLKFKVQIYPAYDLVTRFSVMFKSLDNRAFGVITYKGLPSQKERDFLNKWDYVCGFDNGNDISLSLFEVYLCVDEKVHRGCVYIEKIKLR